MNEQDHGDDNDDDKTGSVAHCWVVHETHIYTWWNHEHQQNR